MLTLLTCLVSCAPEAPVESPDAGDKPDGHVAADTPFDTKALRAMPLPEAPFTARTRLAPTTLVDKHGAPLLVLDAVGVELEVQRVLTDRVWATCSGCRAPVEAWVLRQGVFLGEPADGPQDALLAWSASRELDPVSRHGFVRDGAVWVAPPWHAEGGYSGATVRVVADGDTFALEAP